VQLGYWKDEGLDVEVLGFAGSGATFQALAAGKIDVGQGPPDPLFAASASGEDVVAFYDHVPGNFLMPQVPEDSPIQSAADMKGATIGVASLEAGGVTLIKAMTAKAGLKPSDYDIVAIGTGAEAKQFITKGDVDVVELYDSAYTALGIPLRPIRDAYFESIGFNNAIATTSEAMTANRQAMIGIEGEDLNAAPQHLIAQIARHREFAERCLHADLRERDHAEPQLCRLLDRLLRSLGNAS